MLEPGAFAVFKKSRAYAAGDVLLVDHPRFGTIVKRVADVGEKTLWLEGANATSLSRESMGPIESKSVRGKLVYQIQRGA